MKLVKPILAGAALAVLAACSPRNEAAEAETQAVAEPAGQTVIAAIGEDGELDTLQSVLSNAGLDPVLGGVGPYTVLAPVDLAFDANPSATALSEERLRAQAVAVMRNHILPGALTFQDIVAAADRAGEAGAQMRTMGDAVLTFRRDGEAIVVSDASGSMARLTGEEALASNGAIVTIDAVLAPAPPAPSGSAA